jgi:hypothetical protein
MNETTKTLLIKVGLPVAAAGILLLAGYKIAGIQIGPIQFERNNGSASPPSSPTYSPPPGKSDSGYDAPPPNPPPPGPPEQDEPDPTPDPRIERLRQEIEAEIADLNDRIRDVKGRIEDVRLLGLAAIASNRVEDAKLAVITKVSLENDLKQLRQRKADAEDRLARLE